MKNNLFSILTVSFLLGILFVFSSGSGRFDQAERIIALPELENPRQIVAEENRVYFVDSRDIIVFALEDGRLLKRIGKLGQGPGEFEMGPRRLSLLGDRLIVKDSRGTECFDLEGAYIEGIQLQDIVPFYQILPVGSNFVGFPWLRNEDGSIVGPSGRIYDSNFKEKRKFFGELPAFPSAPPPPGVTRPSKKIDRLLIRDFGDYKVYKDKIYVADSTKGFSISVFDKNGIFLSEIYHSMGKVKVLESFVNEVVKRWKASKDWDSYYSYFNPIVPEYFPEIIDFKIDQDQIYALTAAKKDDLYEIIVMGIEGKILEREFRFPLQPNFEIPAFNGLMYDIDGNKLFWFDYNDDKETYELHIR